MRFVARLAAFLALVAAVLGVAAVIGSQIGLEVATDPDASAVGEDPRPQPASTPVALPAPRLGSDLPEGGAGLAVTSRGMRLVVPDPAIVTGEPTTVRFQLLGSRVRRVAATVVRRDARFLQRPAARREGGRDWAVDLRVPRPGTYRLIVDVDNGRRVLGADLFAPGEFEPMPLPEPSSETSVDGYDVRAERADGVLGFAVSRRGRAVAVRPDGALVGVRAGDMAYVAARPAGGALRFRPRYPGVGRYRLFVPFEHRGRRHVAALTRPGRP